MATKVSLSFGKLGDFELDNFAQGVIDAITGNAAFPTPPVTIANLQSARDDLTAKMAAAQTGGPADTAAKNNSRQTLIGMLRDVAAYVQIRCNDDPAILLSSGFEMQSTNRAQTELTKPTGLSLKNSSSGQLIGRVNPVRTANIYEGRIKLTDGDWLPSVFTGDSQHILFGGLTRGKDYTAQVRALGGSTGHSDWSDPSTHMAM
jgi:hypothetical protein